MEKVRRSRGTLWIVVRQPSPEFCSAFVDAGTQQEIAQIAGAAVFSKFSLTRAGAAGRTQLNDATSETHRRTEGRGSEVELLATSKQTPTDNRPQFAERTTLPK